MKKNNLLLLLVTLVSIPFFAQIDNYENKDLLLREQNAYLRKMNVGNFNPNTANYDLRYQRLDLNINPSQAFVQGSVTSHFIPNQTMNSIYMDLHSSLTVSEVRHQGNTIPFQQLNSHELKIDFPHSLSANVLDSITVSYSGAPAIGQDAVRTTPQPNGTPVFATLNEPYGAQDWFPTKQSLNDKIEKVDLFITTPSQYSVAGNGVLMSETILTSGQKLTKWRTQYPTAAYLIALGITHYTKLNDTIGNPPFPFINYVYPSTVNNTHTMSIINWTKDAMTLFENHFGPYPFRNEKYGHMQFNYSGVAMEHQTMSSMPHWDYGVTAHELAHQWFGNKITCATWNDIWLNEGFAVFGEHMIQEHLRMTPAQFQNYLSQIKNLVTSSPNGSVYVPDNQLTNVGAIFSWRLSYQKGGFVVRMMKWKLGDTAFFSAIRDYLNHPDLAYGYASTNDLKNSLLASTGVDFTEFFNDWIYGQGYPTYNIRWKQSGDNIILQAHQTQSHPTVSFFEMPLPIRIHGTNGEQLDLKLEHTQSGQYFTIPVSFPIASVQFNYENQILERNSDVVHDNQLSIQEVQTNGLSIYPTLAKTEIYIKGLTKKSTYQIFSMDGRLILSGITNPENPILVNHLTKGKYIITIGKEKISFIKE